MCLKIEEGAHKASESHVLTDVSKYYGGIDHPKVVGVVTGLITVGVFATEHSDVAEQGVTDSVPLVEDSVP